jgi:hypothetical protein
MEIDKQKVILIVLIILLVSFLIYYNTKNEGFENSTQNYVYGNYDGMADYLEYGNSEKEGMYKDNNYPSNTFPASSNLGVNQASDNNVFDDRGYKWTKNPKNVNVDVIMDRMSDDAMRNTFMNMYMLDPSNSVSQYDVANMPISIHCCPNQYAPAFDTGDDGESCAYAQKYVANNYSGDSTNSKDGAACVCMKPSDAEFYTKRGGNTTA